MALKNFVDGEMLTSADVNLYLVNSIGAVKTADETVSASTTLQADNELTVPAAASSTYRATLFLIYEGATAGDIKVQLTLPAGATCLFGIWTSSMPVGEGFLTTLDLSSVHALSTSTGTEFAFRGEGLVTIGATAGNVALTWAQNTASGTTTIKAGSYLVLRRIS